MQRPIDQHIVETPPSADAAAEIARPAEEASPGGSVPARRLSPRRVCLIVQDITAELIRMACDRAPVRRDRRRTSIHVRQIAMYVCHVALGFSQQDIGLAFGRDRSTVSYACATVEDRRDDLAFDDFVSAVERLAVSVFAPAAETAHG